MFHYFEVMYCINVKRMRDKQILNFKGFFVNKKGFAISRLFHPGTQLLLCNLLSKNSLKTAKHFFTNLR